MTQNSTKNYEQENRQVLHRQRKLSPKLSPYNTQSPITANFFTSFFLKFAETMNNRNSTTDKP